MQSQLKGLAAALLAGVLAFAPLTLEAKPRPRAHVTYVTKTKAHPRSAAVRHAFMKRTGYLHGRPGYVIDHVIPLACGGADAGWNLQWQTVVAARAKDKIERKGC